MAKTLHISIGTGDFPDLGTPFAPKEKPDFGGDKAKAKAFKPYLDDYKAYTKSCKRALGSKVTRSLTDDYNGNITDGMFEVDLPFEYEDDGDSSLKNTYKFLGMDINANFDAVVKIGSGYVIVGSVFDRDKVLRILNNANVRDEHLVYRQSAADIVRVIMPERVRKLVTYLKTGAVYSLAKMKDNDPAYANFLEDFRKDLMHDLGIISGDDQSRGGVIPFGSVILNIASEKDKEAKEVVGVSVDEKDISVLRFFMLGLTNYWKDLAKEYVRMVRTLSAIDLWSYFSKKSMGEQEFNNKFAVNAVKVRDENGNYEEDRAISFAGAAMNGVVDDGNMQALLVEQVGESITDFAKFFSYEIDPEDIGRFDFSSMVSSFVDLADVGAIQSQAMKEDIAAHPSTDFVQISIGNDSTLDELQAMSVLDSLRYIDEDAEVCKNSYDMHDPEQRGLFVRSAIRSYERNFKEFRPKKDYDVTSAMAEVVEKSDPDYQAFVSLDDGRLQSGKNGGDSYEDGFMVTTETPSETLRLDKRTFLKVMKLASKVFKRVDECFAQAVGVIP